MAAEERILIRFDAKGDNKLATIFKKIYLEQTRLTKGQEQYEKALRKLNTTNKRHMDLLLGIQGQTRNVGGKLSVLRSKLLLASFATTLLTASFKKFIDISSDSNEMLSKASVVFGDQIEIVKGWGDTLGDRVGRAGDKLVEMATTLQDTFVPMGLTRKSAASLSTAMTELAVDVASFNNKTDADVIRDFQSALVGNHETVLKYGIKINEAALKAEAFSQGLWDGHGALTETAKLQARVNLIYAGTTDAQGDALRTYTEYANQVKQLQAKLYEVYKEFGDLLIKYVMPALLWLANHFADTKRIYGYISAIIVLGGVYVAVTAYAYGFRKALKLIKYETIVMSGGLMVLVIALGELITWFYKFGDAADENIKTLEDYREDLGDLNFEFSQNTMELQDNITKMKEHKKSLVDSLKTKIESKKIQIEEWKLLNKHGDAIGQLFMLDLKYAKFAAQKGKALTAAEKTYISLLHDQEMKLLNLKIAEKARIQAKQEQLKIDNLGEKTGKAALAIEREAYILQLKRTKKSALEIKLIQQKWRAESQIEDTFKAYKKLFKATDEADRDQIKLTKSLDDYHKLLSDDEEYKKWIENLKENKFEMNEAEYRMYQMVEAQRALSEETGKTTKGFHQQGYALTNLMDGVGGISQALGGTQVSLQGMSTNFTNTYQSVLDETDDSTEAMNEAYAQMGMAVGAELIGVAMQAHEQRMALTQEQAAAEIDALKSQRKYQKMSRAQQEKEEKKIKSAANKQLAEQFKAKQAANMAAVIMDTSMAIMNAMANIPSPANIAFSVIAGIMGAAQLAEIKKQKPPVMAAGGLVGGNLHAAGGTLIEAEKGEFVMSRRAVDTVGIENMNKINQGQLGTRPINVSFSGNINSDDFIESEAIPKIKDAIRRGADIGVG